MTLKSVAFLAGIAEVAGAALAVANLATNLAVYGERPLLLLSAVVGVIAQASVATFFILYSSQADGTV
jgi:hypothetical protein